MSENQDQDSALRTNIKGQLEKLKHAKDPETTCEVENKSEVYSRTDNELF